MNYLITHEGYKPYVTNWFDLENNWIEGVTVYNLMNWTYCKDGKTWEQLDEDHL